jgi:hypothetical protein
VVAGGVGKEHRPGRTRAPDRLRSLQVRGLDIFLTRFLEATPVFTPDQVRGRLSLENGI